MRTDYDDEFWESVSVSRPSDPIAVVDDFERLLSDNPPEAQLQKYLEQFPWLLTEQFPHAYAALPQFRFGDQYIADFVIPERCSGDTHWMLVEIERSDAILTTKNGEFSQAVRTAIRQVKDWRRWLRHNFEVAKRHRRHGGLSLHDMSDYQIGYIVIGRRDKVTPRFNDLRTELLNSDLIDIVTYDRICEWARKRANFWNGYTPGSVPNRGPGF